MPVHSIAELPGSIGSDVTYGDDLAALVRPVAAGRLHRETGSVRDRSHTADVITDLRARQVRGKAVLTVR
ncbi:hypothetical protein ACFVYE_28245 [Streptomyces sp. NPDC058239]|uniref:hypothetical protein n=1 Tax=unclassified Streptomyces TaxID=2593676 RepID=UPI00366234E4